MKHSRPAATAAILISTALFANATPARASFSLGAFDEYGLLVNNGVSGGDINTGTTSSPQIGNIGIGTLSNGGKIGLHHDVINGPANNGVAVIRTAGTPSQTITTDSTIKDSAGNADVIVSDSQSVPGQPNFPKVESAITAAMNLSNTYGAAAIVQKATMETISSGQMQNHKETINATAGYNDNGTYVFKASSFSIGNGNALDINGTATQYVVLDITGNSNNKLDGALTLTGGITADHVLINFIGQGGSVQGAANGATLQGTFLIPDETVTLNSLTIAGHLFGGAPCTNFQFVSNAFIDQPKPTPEPASAAVVLAGLAGFGWLRRKKYSL